jgi:hypothetical protein
MAKTLTAVYFLLTMTVCVAHGQANPCETIYLVVDNQPAYEGGMSALFDYATKHLSEIIKQGQIDSNEPTAKLFMMLTIDANGNVIDAELSNHKLSKHYEGLLKEKLLNMTGWTPGTLNGHRVCSKFAWV